MPNDRETRIAALEKQLAELKAGKSGGKWHKRHKHRTRQV